MEGDSSDEVTFLEFCHTRSAARDASGAFAARNERDFTGVDALPEICIDEVHSSSVHGHEDLARARLGGWQLTPFENLWSSEFRHLYCVHDCVLQDG